MQTELFRIETPEQFSAAADAAARLLRAGELAAVPTETVYGLAANAFDEGAVRRIFEAKGRPARNPIIVHVASLQMARNCARLWPENATHLAKIFWPGPLTLVLARAEAIPAVVAGGGDTIGIRWPLHPFMQELIRRCGFPLAAPSANRSNEVSATTGEHVMQSLGGRIPLIVDAGPSSVGIESTVLDLTIEPARVLRPGMISAQRIARAWGKPVVRGADDGEFLKSPGLLRKHYAPRARLEIARWQDETELKNIAESFGVSLRKVTVISHDRIPQSNPFGRVAIIPHDAKAFARALYSELHRSDELGAELILVEDVPSGEEWEAIRDRIHGPRPVNESYSETPPARSPV